jgi:PEP-CTERM/exosortase A-associated glycosyltransferase
VIHAHSPALNGVAAVGVGRATGVPVVYEVRAFWEDAAVDLGTSRPGGPRYRLTRAMETWVLRRAAAVTTICEGLRNDIVARGIPAERVTVIPNAVDVSRFRLIEERDAVLEAELGLAGKRVLGFIGSFYSYEGLALLVEALPGMLRQAPEIRLLLVGGGNEAERLRRQAADLGIADAVVFTGRVPHDQVARYYTLCDAMVYPRLSIRLTELVTPLKPLEAMAQEKLVVASDVGGHRELIRPGETGVLFAAGDKGSLTTAVLDLVGHEERWPALRAAGRRFVEQERSWPASVMRYKPVYEGLVPRPASRIETPKTGGA